MAIGILKERIKGENRVALTPDVIKKLITKIPVYVETGAGLKAGFPDRLYQEAGAHVVDSLEKVFQNIDTLISVSRLGDNPKDISNIMKFAKSQTIYMGNIGAQSSQEQWEVYQKQQLSVYALEMIPRISRAQSMDVLSSQANLAGYRAVIEAVYEYGRAMPMMMTAAGTIAPAKVLILGAGVAGLQAIATARRLGAIVSALDVRAAAKEQVESLGAKFITISDDSDGETKGGYAKEMSEDYKTRQATVIKEALRQADIVITTALIPGKPAPRLISKDMLDQMRPGSIVLDMAVSQGGNCEGSQLDQVVEVGPVKIIGYSNLPGRLAQDTSQLYAKNVLNFLNLCWDEQARIFDFSKSDEILEATRIMDKGEFVHTLFTKSA